MKKLMGRPGSLYGTYGRPPILQVALVISTSLVIASCAGTIC